MQLNKFFIFLALASTSISQNAEDISSILNKITSNPEEFENVIKSAATIVKEWAETKQTQVPTVAPINNDKATSSASSVISKISEQVSSLDSPTKSIISSVNSDIESATSSVDSVISNASSSIESAVSDLSKDASSKISSAKSSASSKVSNSNSSSNTVTLAPTLMCIAPVLVSLYEYFH